MVPYLQLLFGAINLAAVYALFKSFIFNMHMYQLNSYRWDKHSRWLKKNAGRYLIEIIVFALSFTGFIENDALMGFAAGALLIGIIALMPENRQRPQKKPLVFTARVKRMTATVMILFALTYAGAIACLASEKKHLAFLVMGLLCSLAPLYIPAANLINVPVEKLVQKHYRDEAEKILAESRFLDITGITGSYGKTSVKFYLYTILRSWTDTLVTPASVNTPMGIVRLVREELKASHKIFICEMGADHLHDIKEICDIVHPRNGIITALGDQHLETFKTRENIIKTKYELADALPADGRLYVNWDNEIIRENPPKRPYIRYGLTEDCDYYAYNINVSPQGTTFTVRGPEEEGEFETKLLGRHSAINITGAIAAANGYGMSFADIKKQVRKIEAVPHRMQIVNKGGITIIDDAFNSNPAGCRAALTTLGDMEGERILVTPGMVELGEKEAQLNSEFGAFAASHCDRVFLIGEKQTAPIKKGLLEAGFPEASISVYEQFTDAMKYIYAMPSAKKKIVLLENDLPDNY